MKRIITSLFLIGSIFPLFSKDLSISVIDRDLELPLEGVRITEADSGLEIYTDYNGEAVLELPEDTVRAVIIAELVGYEARKQLVTDFKSPLEVGLLMEGILEGQELVVEAEAIGETDEEVGVSTVVEKETIKSAAKMGLIEDVMNVVKILPGVTYSGGFGSAVSVRGGDPSGLTAVMDGFTVKYPYHWGGMFSIFNPNIVESIKFSPGIFSAKYGQATSALMEVNTVNPTDGLKFNGILSTSTIEGFAQVPFGKNDNFGVSAGFRLTNYDLALGFVNTMADVTDDKALKDTVSYINRAPYIYDFYFKTLYSPSEKLKWHINGFWGNDGIGIKAEDPVDKSVDIANNTYLDYINSDAFVNTGIKFLTTDNLLFNLVIGYEKWRMDIDSEVSEEGYREYSQAFRDKFSQYSLGDGFSLLTESDFTMRTDKHGIQGRFDADWSINDKFLLQAGLGSNLEIRDRSSSGSQWMITYGEGDLPEYKSMDYGSDVDSTKALLNFAYFNLNSNLVPDLVKFDLGCRVDHSYFMGLDDYTLNTYPEVAPRFNLTFTPDFGNSFFKKSTFSIGTGLFNKNPFGNGGVRKSYGIEDFELRSEKTFTSVLGWETELPKDNRFKIEGYYKYMFDRFYYNALKVDNEMQYKLHFDGYGHAYGGDLLLERKTSRYLDGMLTYTLVNAQYMDPETDGLENDSTEVRGEYYYPTYHRFHSLNLLFNVKPTQGFTMTTKLSFATGNPKNEVGDIIPFAAMVKDADGNDQIAEMYTSKSIYSDTLRTNFALPLDLKFSWHNYKPDSKYEWEFYFAVQDALSPLITAIQTKDSQVSKWSGESRHQPSDGSFSFPIPSVGFSLSF